MGIVFPSQTNTWRIEHRFRCCFAAMLLLRTDFYYGKDGLMDGLWWSYVLWRLGGSESGSSATIDCYCALLGCRIIVADDNDDGHGLWSVQRMSALLPTTIIFSELKDDEIRRFLIIQSSQTTTTTTGEGMKRMKFLH